MVKLYLGLLLSIPQLSKETHQDGIIEVKGGGYERVEYVVGSDLNFPTPTDDWGRLVAAAIFDAPSGGNMICWSKLSGTAYILNGHGGPTFREDKTIEELLSIDYLRLRRDVPNSVEEYLNVFAEFDAINAMYYDYGEDKFVCEITLPDEISGYTTTIEGKSDESFHEAIRRAYVQHMTGVYDYG